MAKETKLNAKQTEFLSDLGTLDSAMTLNEINSKFGTDFKSGTINSLVKRGVVAYGDYKEVIVSTKRKVHTYKIVQ